MYSIVKGFKLYYGNVRMSVQDIGKTKMEQKYLFPQEVGLCECMTPAMPVFGPSIFTPTYPSLQSVCGKGKRSEFCHVIGVTNNLHMLANLVTNPTFHM